MTLSLAGLSYSGNSIPVEEGLLVYPDGDVKFNTDGSKMFICGYDVSFVQRLVAYELSVEWDVTTAVVNAEFLVPEHDDPQSMVFKSDGLKLYIADGGTTIDEYTLSSAWDVSSATFIQSLDVSSEVGTLKSLHVSEDGMMLYTGDYALNYYIKRWSTTGSWSLTGGAIDVGQSYIPFTDSGDKYSYGVWLDSTGLIMYVLANFNDVIYEYTLGVAWDLTTVSYADDAESYFSVTGQDTNPRGFFVNAEHIYVLGGATYDVFQYDFEILKSFSGTVSQEGVHVARTVRIYDRATGIFIAETISDAETGEFIFDEVIDNGVVCYIVILDDDDGDDYNALIYGRVTGV